MWHGSSLHSIEDALTLEDALKAMSLAFGLAGLMGFWLVRKSLRGVIQVGVMVECWHFGRWLGGASVMSWVAGQVYVYSAGWLLGPASVGAIRTAESLLRPLGVMMTFLDTTLPIKFSRILSSKGPSALTCEVRRNELGLAVPIILFCSVLAMAGPEIVAVLYGESYASYRWLPVLWGLVYLLMAMIRILNSSLRAMQLGSLTFLASLASLISSLVLAWWVVKYGGVYGALLGMLATYAVMFMAQLSLINRNKRSP